jgi:hypothetical protein
MDWPIRTAGLKKETVIGWGFARGNSDGYSNNGTFLSCSLRTCTLKEDGIKNSLSPTSRTLYLLEFSKCQIYKGNELQKILKLLAGLGNSYVI